MPEFKILTIGQGDTDMEPKERLLNQIAELVREYEANNYPQCIGLVISFTTDKSSYNWNAGFEPKTQKP